MNASSNSSSEVLRLAQVSLAERLHSVSLSLRESQHCLLFGPNGSGKSSLLAILAGRLWPSSGSVVLLGQELGASDIRDLRRAIGRIDFEMQLAFQRAAFPVEEVVVSGFFDGIGLQFNTASAEQREAAAQALSLVSSESLRLRIFRELSYGEQKRVLLARALVHQPRLLLLDEPCAGLDLLAKQRFFEQVAALLAAQPQLATVWSSHHVEEIPAYVRQVLLLKEGRVFRYGKAAELITTDTLTELFGIPVEVIERQGVKAAFVDQDSTI